MASRWSSSRNPKIASSVGRLDAEHKKLEKDRENAEKFIKSIDAKLANKAFVDKAPAEVVQQQRDKRAELAAQMESIDVAIKKLRKSS